MRPKSTFIRLYSTIVFILFFSSSFAQLFPVSLDQRVANSPIIAIGRLKEQQCYWDDEHANIYTRNVLEVKAWFKGAVSSDIIVAISPGGIVNGHAEYVCPAEVYQPGIDYLVLLKDDENYVDDKSYRAAHPDIKQCLSYAGVQSVLSYQEGVYKDALAESPMTEEQLLNKMKTSYGLEAKRPDGTKYTARTFTTGSSHRLFAVTSITDGTGSLPATGFVAGTIPPNNELIINGSGFGATTGSVQFANVDNGGATNISTVATDIISWSDAQIRVKIPGTAGSGNLIVFDNASSNVGTSPITIKWGEINTSSTFLNHASSQRQQVRLLDRNGSGGYTFEYSSNTGSGPAFSADASAKAAFQRALRTLRCATLVNYNVLSTGSNAAGFADDDINIVMYDNVTLPAGALGVCTSRFNASGFGGLCDLFNTVWYLKEMDIRVLSIPNPGFTWNFSTGAPTGSQFDFESVMLHETGHGHGLTHINVPALTMYFSISNGSSKRTLSADEIEAGQYRISVSNSNCLNTNGFGGFTPHAAISSGECNTLLPLSLLDFSGQKRENEIELQWVTEWETNVRGFYVEKSTDGQNFNPAGFVPAAGYASVRNTYTFFDNIRLPVIVYYRLRMEDNDNKFKYSKIISFKPDNKGWKLFPNPVGDNLYLVPEKTSNDKTLLQVSDLSGRILISRELAQLSTGIAIPIPVKKLIPGVYIIKVVSGKDILFVEKIHKQ